MKKENIATKELLEKLKSEGYVFRLPGGSSRNGEHASLGVVYEYEGGTLYFLLVPYNADIKIPRKYENVFEEVPEGTLELKTLEQTGVRIRSYSKIGTQEAKNNREEVHTEKHIKHVFTTQFYDDSNIRNKKSSDGRLGPPLWVSENLIMDYLFVGHVWAYELFGKFYTPLHHHVDAW